MEREEMLIYLKRKLSPKRYVHSIGVEYTAASMAFVHGEDVQRARIAGLLHDCAKNIPVEEKLKKALKFGIPVSDSERKDPELLHGKLGAYYAKEKCGVTDEDQTEEDSGETPSEEPGPGLAVAEYPLSAP